ncbi:MAG TPA: type II secretion system protein GspC [Gammaproteobacteria bacterium]|jgi:general secretion pathway protein C|nr:type II secretion system protein GspC [Gammaproteobacteria bacterium]
MTTTSDIAANPWIKWVNAALVAGIAYALSGLTIQLLTQSLKQDAAPQQTRLQATETKSGKDPIKLSRAVASTHLFGKAGEKPVEPQVETPQVAPETRLNLTLAGVFAYQPAQMAIAIISSGGREEQVYGIGDKIGNATLKAVYPDRVIIENRGREETLKLPEDVAPIAIPRVNTASANNNRNNKGPVELPASPRALRDKLVKNPSMLGKIVSATPYQQGGKLVGYRLQPKQNPEILEAQGIMANDVITKVNGIGLNSQKQGIRALRKLVKADNIELTVLRDGIEVPIMISLDQ